MLHNIIIYLWTVSVTVVLGLVCILIASFDRTGNAIHNVIRAWARSILWVSRVRVELNGMEHIDTRGSCILMSNHQSNFDIPVLLGSLAVQTRWLAKAELFKIPIFGHAMRRSGFISIDRSNRESAFKSLKEAAETIRAGTSVLIFPEGTRSDDGRIKPFKKGGFVLAVDAAVPVVPIVIDGTFEVMPKQRLRIQPRRVAVNILEAIDITGYTRANRNELMETVRNAMVDFQNSSGGKGQGW